jgi:hypothetical protein
MLFAYISLQGVRGISWNGAIKDRHRRPSLAHRNWSDERLGGVKGKYITHLISLMTLHSPGPWSTRLMTATLTVRYTGMKGG